MKIIWEILHYTTRATADGAKNSTKTKAINHRINIEFSALFEEQEHIVAWKMVESNPFCPGTDGNQELLGNPHDYDGSNKYKPFEFQSLP